MRVLVPGRGSPILAATAALAILASLPASAAAWSPTTKLAGPGNYWSNSVATEGDNVVVSWLENASHLVYRTSTDRGKTFNPPVDLGTANPGAVTLCGDGVVGIRLDTGAGTVKLDRRVVAGPQSSYIISTIASGRDLTLTGIGVVCVDGRRIATFWDEYVGGELHLKVAVVSVHLALQAYEFDLGPAPIYRIRGITATRTGIWIAWSTDSSVIVQRLDVGTGTKMKVKVGTRTELDPGCAAGSVGVAAAGRRVYVAYDCSGEAILRISNDRGTTFGRERVIYQSATDPVSIYGLAAKQNVVAASVHVGPWCGGCVGSNRAVYSTNWGRAWTAEGPTNTGGYMANVALLGSGSTMRVVQAWDNRTSHESYGNPGYMRFSIGKP
jgi:hypothetical protein